MSHRSHLSLVDLIVQWQRHLIDTSRYGVRIRSRREWRLAGADGLVRMRRDGAGVPHVEAASLADALRGLGYCHGRDRCVQLVLMRLIGQGRAAEVLEGSDELAELDTVFRRLNLGRGCEAEVGKLPELVRGQLEAYCAGVNAALERRRPWELAALRYRPEPWRARDTMLLCRLTGYLGLASLQGDMERVLVELVHDGADLRAIAALVPGHADIDVELLRSVTLGVQALPAATRQMPLPLLGGGSNAWAIAPRRARGDSTLLASDPHLEVNRLPAVWYEAVLGHGEQWCAGATMPGLPGVLIGRSAELSWGMTNGGGDATDSWVEDCRDGCFRRELSDGLQWLPFLRRDEVVRRRGRPPLALTVFENEHGVLDGDPHQAGRYLCTRWAAAQGTGANSLSVLLSLLTARDAEAAAAMLARVELSFSWVVADRKGSIALQTSGRIPRRRGDGIFPLAGWDPGNDWDGYLAPQQLPCRIDPPEGFVASANADLDLPGSAAVITLPMPSYRGQRIAQLLAEREGWTVADCARLQLDCVSPQAQRFLVVLRPLLAADPRFDAIAAWDGSYTDDSYPAAWFESFYASLIESALVSVCGERVGRFIASETALVATYFGLFDEVLLNADGAWHGQGGRDVAFRRAAEQAFANSPRTLAQRQPLVMGNLLLHGRLPSWLGFDRRPGALHGGRATIRQGQRLRFAGREISFGQSYRMVTTLAEPLLRTALPGGPSDRRFSRWYGDGIAGWENGRLKPLGPHMRG